MKNYGLITHPTQAVSMPHPARQVPGAGAGTPGRTTSTPTGVNVFCTKCSNGYAVGNRVTSPVTCSSLGAGWVPADPNNTGTWIDPCATATSNISCDSCDGGYPTSMMYAGSVCPTGTIQSGTGNPCPPNLSTPTDCTKCVGGSAVSNRVFGDAACSSLGAGWIPADPNNTGTWIDPCPPPAVPSGYLDCWDCNNQIMNRIDNTQTCQQSYPGSLTSIVSGDTGVSANPCPLPPPPPDIVCHNCDTGVPQSYMFQGQSCPAGWTANPNPCSTGGFGVSGCTNPNAYNYNPSATIDDGSCAIPIIPNPNLWPDTPLGPTCAEYPDMMGCPPPLPPPPLPPIPSDPEPVIVIDDEPIKAGLGDNKLLIFGLIGVAAYMLLKGQGIKNK